MGRKGERSGFGTFTALPWLVKNIAEIPAMYLGILLPLTQQDGALIGAIVHQACAFLSPPAWPSPSIFSMEASITFFSACKRDRLLSAPIIIESQSPYYFLQFKQSVHTTLTPRAPIEPINRAWTLKDSRSNRTTCPYAFRGQTHSQPETGSADTIVRARQVRPPLTGNSATRLTKRRAGNRSYERDRPQSDLSKQPHLITPPKCLSALAPKTKLGKCGTEYIYSIQDKSRRPNLPKIADK